MANIDSISVDRSRHMHEAYPPKFDLSFRFGRLSEGDMQSYE